MKNTNNKWFNNCFDNKMRENQRKANNFVKKWTRKLTPRQKNFCYNIVTFGLNKTQAYRNSYNTYNMSDRCVRNEAYKLAKQPKIKKEIAKLHSKLSEREKKLKAIFDPLTQKQITFIDNWFHCFRGSSINLSEAYRITYDTSNMSRRTIHNKASLMMKNPKIILLLKYQQAMLRGEFR